MTASLNKVCLIGNIGQDPETRSTASGGRMARFSLATTERWKDRNQQTQERTEWHRIVVFSEGLVGVVERFLRRGSKIYIEGSLQTRKWRDDAGQERTTTEITLGFNAKLIMLDRSGGKQGGEAPPDHEKSTHFSDDSADSSFSDDSSFSEDDNLPPF